MISLKVCRNTIIRFLVILVLISSLIVPPCGYAQDAEDSQIFIAGFNAYQQKDYAGTIEKMNEVLQKYPDSPLRDMVLFWLSRAYYKNGNQQEAAKHLSLFSKEYPDNPLKSTVEDELIQLADRYDKGEKLPAGNPPVKAPARQTVAQKEKLTQQRKADEARIAAEKQAADKRAAEKAEADRLAQAKAEQERIAAAKLTADKAATEKAAAAELTRLAALKAEEDRKAAEKAEADRLAQAKAEQERIAAAKLAADKATADKAAAAELTRLAALKAEEDRKAAEKAEADRLAQANAEQERIAAQKAEEARLAAAKAEAEKLVATQSVAEKAAAEKIAAEQAAAKLAADKSAAEKAETDRLAQAKAEQERIAANKAEEARLAAAKLEAEKLAATQTAAEQAAAAKVAAEQAELVRQAQIKSEQTRLAAEKQAAEQATAKAAAEKAELERLAKVKAEQERIVAAKAEETRLAEEKTEKEKRAAAQIAAQKAADAKLAAEKAEQERLAALKTEEDRKTAEKAEVARIAQTQAEQELLAAATEETRKLSTTQPIAENEVAGKIVADQAELVRQAQLKAEQANKRSAEQDAADKAEAARSSKARAEEEREAAVKAEEARLAAAKAERDLASQAKDEQERIAALKAEETRIATAQAEQERLAQAAEQQAAEEKKRSAQKAMREKAIAQYKSIIETYPNSKAATAAAAKLKELGVAVALPTAQAAAEPEQFPENSQVLRLEVSQFAGFEFNLLAEPQAHTVAQLIAVPFEVTNRGNGNDVFALESGFPAEFKTWFSAAAAPDKAISQTTTLAPGESFKGNVNLMIPASSIDGLRFTHPVKATSRFMLEATQSREVKLTAAAPLLRAIVKTAKTAPLPGEKVSYKVAILNVGSVAANEVTFRLDYPPQLEAADAVATGFKQEGKGVMTLSGLTVNSGESKEFTLEFVLKQDSLAGQELLTRGEIRNTRLETTAAFVSNAAIVQAQRGVQVRTAANRQTVIPGQTITVPFVVTNTGNIREKFAMTSQVTGAREAIVFHDLNRDGIRQASEPVITEVGPLAPREEANIVIEIKTPRSAVDGSEGNARITFTSEGDPNQSFVGGTRLVYSRPVLQMAMAGKGGQLKPGDVATFDLTITNNGSNLARVVELLSYWPEQLELVAADPVNSSIQNGTILWKFKEVGAAEKRTIKVSFRVKPGTGVGTAIQVKNSLKYEDQLGNRY